MKKIVFVLVLLLFTAPAWATTVTIDACDVGGGQVEITYVSDGNLPRAFGLDITVTDGNIIAVIAAMEGECTASVRGFGIFPSTIVIDANGNITDAGTPLSTVQPALGGLDTNGVTVEAGSLYLEPNSPLLSGVICTITVTENCTVRIVGNAARCGSGSPAYGVVMEDPDEVPIVNYVPGEATVGCTCFGDIGYLDETTWEDTYGQDGKVDYSDFNLFLVAFATGGYNITSIPPELLCADMGYLDETTWEDTWGADGKIDYSDFNMFLVRFAASGYDGPCLEE